MRTEGIIVAALAIGVGAYLVFRKQPKSECDQLCTSTGDPGGHAVCVAACNVGGGLLGDLGGLLHQGRPNAQVLADEAKQNDALNGPIKTPTSKLADPAYHKQADGDPPELPYGLGGNAVEYQNGCVPVWGAPGWEKCAKGTTNMWREEWRNLSDDANLPAKKGAVWARAARLRPTDPPTPVAFVKDQHVMRSGSFDPSSPDPTTQGPQPNADGSNTWLVAGVPVKCSSGQCPQLADATHFAWPPKCGPIPQVIAPGVGNPTGGGDIRTAVAGCPTPPGFTWDKTSTGTWYLRRLRVTETTVNQGPCAPASSSTGVKAIAGLTVFGVATSASRY